MKRLALIRTTTLVKAFGPYAAIAILKLYQWTVSPILFAMLGPACRFQPTCSTYALEAITEYGITRGGWMALRRLARCRPGGGWGYDPPACAPRLSTSSKR